MSDLAALSSALDPASVFERKKLIIEAIQFEIDLQEINLKGIEEEKSKAEATVNALEEALCDAEMEVSSLEDARNSMIDTLTPEQRTEFVAQAQ